MKKVLFTIALVAFGFAANAQLSVGGSFGLSHGSNHGDDYVWGNTTTEISINPKVGYQLDDKMQVGLSLGWNHDYTRSYVGADDTYTSTPINTISIAPYFRYNVADWKDFTFFCEAALNVKIGLESKTHSFVNGDEVSGSPSDNGDNYTGFGISIVPGVNYAINEHFSVDAYINVIGCYWNMTSADGWGEHNWGLGLNLRDRSVLSFGINYAF